ncbi:MAG: potassium-transporting ATPase subunit KdpB [Dongiaceae bacterium]
MENYLPLLRPAGIDTLRKLNPIRLYHNPIIFITWLIAAWVTLLVFGAQGDSASWQIAFWLWFTVIFANFAESLAQGRGKAQANSLKKTRAGIKAQRQTAAGDYEMVDANDLEVGDIVLILAGEIIPCDGEVIDGIASVDESAITGESAPVIRESGGDRSAVTAGTRVLSDRIKVRVSAKAGNTFLDRMIDLVEGAERHKTPNEIALQVLLLGSTLSFTIVCLALLWLAPPLHFSLSPVALSALFITLIPTTIGGLLSAIGIAGMDRLVRFNVLAMSGRAVEAAGDVDILLLDKTGTITLGNRVACALIPLTGVDSGELADAAQLSSLYDETPEGRSIVVYIKEKFGLRGRDLAQHQTHFVSFSAVTRLSGLDIDGVALRKGAVEAIKKFVASQGSVDHTGELDRIAEKISREGGTPLAVSKGAKLLGVIHLKDVVKGGIRDRCAELRRMGIRTIMITGDNPLTAGAVAAEAGVDDFLAEATPEDKLRLIRAEQAKGKLIAMCGDGTNDAPALAQADVGVAMNTGTMAAREAGNMIDLDSDPTKLIEIVGIGKQLLMTRGALTTFSIANDIAKYFAILPAMMVASYPALGIFNIMHLTTPASALLSAVIFNALIIIALIPLALRGVPYRPLGASKVLARHLLMYGLGGIITPFIGIKAIDMLISALGWA